MNTATTRLLPFRQFNENDIVNFFSLTGTGLMGTLVSIGASNWDNQNDWASTAPGASFDRITSLRYEVKTKVRPCQSGDRASSLVGFTLFNVAETDENGEKYAFYPQKKKENSVVLSGDAVPILTKGFLALSSGAASNAAAIGDVVVPSITEDGKVQYADPSTEVGPRKYYDSSVTGWVANTGVAIFDDQVFGKVIGTGSKFGGYAIVQIG